MKTCKKFLHVLFASDSPREGLCITVPAKSIIVIDADGDGTGHEHAMFFTNQRGDFDK